MGRLTAWTALMMPFFDRPDIQVEVLFYPAARPLVPGPPTVFTDRFWDDIDHWLPPGVGMVPHSFKPFLGTVPDQVLGPLVGTPDQFANGISYADYLAKGGAPLTPCAKAYLDCGACPSGLTTPWYLHTNGWGPPGDPMAALLNQPIRLDYTGSCVWESDLITDPQTGLKARWEMFAQAAGVTIGIKDPTFTLVVASGGTSTSWDCRTCFNAGLSVFSGRLTFTGQVIGASTAYGCDDMIPPGCIMDYDGSTAPGGWVLCDGTAYPTGSPYDQLFAVIGHTHDTDRGAAAPPSGQFRVPNLSGLTRRCAGPASTMPTTSARVVGHFVGQETAGLDVANLPPHNHPVTDPGHSHAVTDPGHSHPVTDPGHHHYSTAGYNFMTNQPATTIQEGVGASSLGAQPFTSSDPTGVAVGSGPTGIVGTQAAPTGVSTGNTGAGAPVQTVDVSYICSVIIKL